MRRNLQTRSMLCNYGNQVESTLSNCGHTCNDLGIGSGRKGRTEKFVKVWLILLLCNGRSQNFHISEN